MKQDNQWSPRAKAPDPDDLSSDRPPGSAGQTSHHAGRAHIDYTATEHHEDIPDSRDSGDPSRPQGEFWHQNERPGADALEDVWPERSRKGRSSDPPVKLTPETGEGTAELPAIFFADVRHKDTP